MNKEAQYKEAKAHFDANPKARRPQVFKQFKISAATYYKYVNLEENAATKKLKKENKIQKAKVKQVTAIVPHTIDYGKPVSRIIPASTTQERAVLIYGHPADLAKFAKEFFVRGY